MTTKTLKCAVSGLFVGAWLFAVPMMIAAVSSRIGLTSMTHTLISVAALPANFMFTVWIAWRFDLFGDEQDVQMERRNKEL